MATEQPNRIEDFRPPLWPEDFGERLERLKKMAGLTWRNLAGTIGVTDRGMLKWRRAGRPSGPSYWALMEFASNFPGGFNLMLGGMDDADAHVYADGDDGEAED